MNNFLVHWLFVMLSVALLSACTSGGSLPAEEEADPFFDPLPSGLPVFTEIHEPYLNASADGESLSLFSYKTQETATENAIDTEVFSTSSDIILVLNTEKDNSGSTEFTLIAKNDSVYLINHQSNEIRLLSHFVNKVCELIPTEVVSESEVTTGPGGQKRLLTVLHGELIYVMTAEPSLTGDSCLSDSKKRFYALPLDHQLDPSLEEDGELDSLALVKESRARAKLIFGWDADPDNLLQEIMVYGYLGYAVEEQELSLFDKDMELLWTQDRELQRFDQVTIKPETLSDKYIFHVQALKNQQYLIQLGLDVFVIDAGDDLLSKSVDQTEMVLSDKVMSVEVRTDNESSVYAVPVTTKFDDEDLILIDNSKIYRLAYQRDIPIRVPNIDTEIVPQNMVNFDSQEHLSRSGFSQFDLELCKDDDFDCIAAHDVEAQTWQFLTRCEAEFGCVIATSTEDFCETREENLTTNSSRPICSPSDYNHIEELNQLENDAELLAHMQYVDDYVRHIEFILQKKRLFITAQMNEKDIFLAYDFNQGFSAPKPVREQVFFGERASLTGLDAYFSNDNLFLTALSKGALRSNECYKEGKRVACNLGELLENGGGNSCTGKDLVDELCTDQFNEYESSAIFCSENELLDLSCSDAVLDQIDDLFVESSDEDAKWFPVYDYSTGTKEIYLLTGDHDLALETENIDEGKLYLPTAFTVDQNTGQKVDRLAEIENTVELVVGGVRYKEPTPDEPGVFGRLDFISDEISQEDSQLGLLKSKLSTYLLEQTFENSLPTTTTPDVIEAPQVAERLFDRF